MVGNCHHVRCHIWAKMAVGVHGHGYQVGLGMVEGGGTNMVTFPFVFMFLHDRQEMTLWHGTHGAQCFADKLEQ